MLDAREVGARDRVALLRLLGEVRVRRGRLRSAAAAYWRALRVARDEGLSERHDWAPLANIYRTLWQQTGSERYYRQYLRFTCEHIDAVQVREAARTVFKLRGARPPART